MRAILGQQVSVVPAAKAARLTAIYGAGRLRERLRTSATVSRPEALVEADPAVLQMPAARVRAIAALAKAVVAEGTLRLDVVRELSETVAALEELPGIGPWTAQYIAMRALGEPDAFPAGDLGLRRALGSGAGLASAAAVAQAAEAWRPWRAYAVLYL